LTQELWDKIPIPEWNISFEDTKNDFLSLLENLSFESLELLLEDQNSPQYRGFEWITSDPNYFEYGQDRVLQRWVLAVFALGITETLTGMKEEFGDIFYSWMKDTDECTWYSTRPKSVCNADGLYERIDIRDANLYGTLPSEMALLSNSLSK
jgi:hypothetical protein